MAEIIKYQANEVYGHIKHDMRDLPAGSYGSAENNSVDLSLSDERNYSLIDRGKTSKEINQWRKNLEKDIFKFNRKDLVHAVEVVVQCPADCPAEQHDDFFQACHDYVASLLPMGEDCIFVSEVHRDELYKIDGEILLDKDGNPMSKEHIHIMFTPAVPDTKHEDYDFKLCANDLTSRQQLKEFHPGLQKHLKDAGVEGTVYSPKNDNGKALGLSVKQLKELTRETGKTFEEGLTIEKLSEIIKENDILKDKISILEKEREHTWGENTWGREETWEKEF